MPFNGSGTFSRLYSWVVDAANSVNISSTRTDAEMNGFAAGLSNCITRDGQSPPSADLPMGGKKLTNLGNATVGTDALNMATGDGRYVQPTTLSGYASLSANQTISGTNSFSGQVSFLPSGTAFNGALATHTDGTAANVICDNNGSGAALIAFNRTGSFACYLGLDVDNNLKVGGWSMGANSYLIWTQQNLTSSALNTIYGYTPVNPTALAAYAPLASPALTGTPTAPTATAGTATTQLATTAFVDGLRDVPSNAKTASYQLALTDRGGGVDFNGTSLTCTIPANSGTAFPIGTTIVLTNLNPTALSIAITTDALTLAGTTTTGTRTLSQNGIATLRKITSTAWLISGAGLS